MDLPKCQKCNNGLMIPLSDYGQEGASVMYKAWACTNPDCGFSIRIDKGEITYGKRIEPKHSTTIYDWRAGIRNEASTRRLRTQYSSTLTFRSSIPKSACSG